MSRRRRMNQCGDATIEFILVGIGVLFMLFSIFEICRGMWIYTTLAHAVKAGARYAVVHGTGSEASPSNCTTTGNLCGQLVQSVAQQIRNASMPLDPGQMQVTMYVANTLTSTSGYGPSSCSTAGSTCTLSALLASTDLFPINATLTQGTTGQYVTISAQYPFNTFISMFWPGSRRVNPFGLINLPAIAQQRMEF